MGIFYSNLESYAFNQRKPTSVDQPIESVPHRL
jgi:hypothetical protein